MLIRALMAVLLLAGFAFAQSSQSPPKEQHQTATQQTPAASAEEKQPPKSFGQSLAIIWARTWEDPVAFFTFALACLTGALVVVSLMQGYFLLRADRTARLAAEAADSSARAAIALQLPLIRIKPEKLERLEGHTCGDDFEECSVSSVIISNLGSTRAFPTEILYGWNLGDDVLPKEPSYRYSERFPINFFIEPDPKTTPRKILTMGMPLEAGQWFQICLGNYCWFYCALLYTDFMGEPHSHGFCWRWASKGTGMEWIADNTPSYNRRT